MFSLSRINNALQGLKNALSTNKAPAPKIPTKKEFEIILQKWYENVYRREIEDLQRAKLSALDPYRPSRALLIDVYNDAVKNDAHLRSVIEKRVKKVTNKKFKIIDRYTKKINEKGTEFFTRKWFKDFRKEAMYAECYGYTLIELTNHNDDFKVTSFDRRYVVPELNIIVRDYMTAAYDGSNPVADNVSIFDYTSEAFFPWFFEIKASHFGLLETIAPISILKRHAWGAWAGWIKRFGQPLIYAKTTSRNEAQREETFNFLEGLAGAKSAVFSPDTEIDMLETSSTDAYNVFLQLINTVDEQVSKCILGNTLTIGTAKNGNRNLAEVHAASEAELTQDDEQEIAYLVNDRLIPLMRDVHGKPLGPNDMLVWDDDKELTLEERRKNDDMLMRHGHKLDDGYLTEKYDVILAKTTPVIDLKKKASSVVNSPITAFYENMHSCTHGSFQASGDDFEEPANENIINRLIRYVHENVALPEMDDTQVLKLVESYLEKLTEAITGGFGDGDFDTVDEDTLEALKGNIELFSTAKVGSELKDIKTLLFDQEGKLKAFAEFKKDVLDLHSNYSKHFLRTEYNTSLASAQMARKWNEIQRDAETLPLLKYKAIKDDRTRPTHKDLDEVILPINHVFWNQHYPPLGWNCRCMVQQLSTGEATPEGNIPTIEIPAMFRNNVGKTRQIFNMKHPYYTNQP